ncbi:MAG: hypothetical protein ACLU5I_06455 [Alistipes finegoldii]|jgi:hypothetical protein
MSTYAMAADIQFPESRGRRGFGLRRASEIHTEKSWKEFTGTAELILPRNVKDFPKLEQLKLFEVGDPIVIKFGYGAGELPTEFIGYISGVEDGVPYRLKCEDEMYKLKRGQVTVSRSGITLKQLLTTIAPGYEIVCPDIALGAVRYTDVAPIDVLENLKKELGLYTYFVGKVLHSVDGYSLDGPTLNIVLEKNSVSDNINRVKEVDEKILVKFRSLQRNGKYLKIEIGDKYGTVQTRNWPYLTEKEIRLRAKRIIELAKAKGFDGTITLLAIPRAELGMRVDFKSLFYKSREGTYYIDKIAKSFTASDGIRQVVTLGSKVL